MKLNGRSNKTTTKAIPKNAKKAYLVVSCIATILNVIYEELGDELAVRHPDLHALSLQCKRSMNVFYVKAGKEEYFGLSKKLSVLWGDLLAKHNSALDVDEFPVLVEWLCMLIPPKDFYYFLGVQAYSCSLELSKKSLQILAHSVLDLDAGLNLLCNTKPYSLTKPKEIAIKIKKERDKKKKTIVAEKTKSNELNSKQRKQQKHRERVAMKKSKLSERIRLAQERASNQNTKSESPNT